MNANGFLTKNAEHIFVAIVFALLVHTGYAALAEHKIVHSYPYGYYASDAFQDDRWAQVVIDTGQYKYLPWYMAEGRDDVLARYPPPGDKTDSSFWPAVGSASR